MPPWWRGWRATGASSEPEGPRFWIYPRFPAAERLAGQKLSDAHPAALSGSRRGATFGSMGTDLIDVRPARAGDAERLSEVHDEAWRNAYSGLLPALSLEKILARRGPAYWQKLATQRSDTLSVLVFAGEVAGYATHGPSRVPRLPYRGEIYELYLSPAHQGVGLGRQLFTRARRRNGELGLKGTIVWALAENGGACGFYARLGGATVARAYENFAGRQFEKLAFGWS